MTEKDKILPILRIFGQDADKPTIKWEASAETQRDVDWERVKPLVEALKNIAQSQCLAPGAEDGLHTPCPSCQAKQALAGLEKEKKV